MTIVIVVTLVVMSNKKNEETNNNTNYDKKDASKKIAKLITCLILVAGLYFSTIVLMQLPFNVYVMPIALTLYVATLLITVGKLNKE